MFSNHVKVYKSLSMPFAQKICSKKILNRSLFIKSGVRYTSSDKNDSYVEEKRFGDVEQLCSSLDNGNQSWWSLYVRGEVPDYPPRKKMFEKLTSEGIDVESMETFEVEDFTRWLLMREIHGKKYPKFPYDIRLEDKIEDLKNRIPLKHDD
ncbi:hypothetical protein BEWA_011240 [Theileria equi strain WA]|uniref:Uncharacterized protein n=1 Tax=Theileria equi strain WA TaxID=1537102 RepID=L0B3A6_THEEQ|nr:hypothetical protein BEWA_011240 [Theileria equi strain WA]AFZ81706.1 hypothetical protein BEWA_011240 [Theileria equi strain WA]|eukprot:XP_004831372.1 hypothetical protein BEWA_011240 [Theileria equi strain WA]